MRAAFYTEYGGPEILQVLFPVVPGWDVAGVVERVGLDTPEFAEGDEVYAYARKDFVHGGTYADLVAVPVRAMARKPRALTWDEAAAVPLAGLTAYQLLTRLGTQSGGIVLVNGAAGGVGTFAVQLGRLLGARVIGTASERNHEFVAGLGAEPVAYGEGLADRVRALAPGGVDVVADFAGGVTDMAPSLLAPGGRHGSVVDGAVAANGGLYGWVRPDGEQLGILSRFADEGRLAVPLAGTFELEKVADSWRAVMEGHTRGKIALHVSD